MINIYGINILLDNHNLLALKIIVNEIEDCYRLLYYVSIEYEIKNKDRVRIITDDLSFGPRMDWLDMAKTSYAKKKIMEFNSK